MEGKSYKDIAKTASDANDAGEAARVVFESAHLAWCLKAMTDSRDNKAISQEMGVAVKETNWKITTNEDAVSQYKVIGLVMVGDVDAVVDDKVVVTRPGGSHAVGVDRLTQWSLTTAINSLRRSGASKPIGLDAIRSAVVTAAGEKGEGTRQDRVNAIVALSSLREAAESKAKDAAAALEIAQAAVAESEGKEKAKREKTVLGYLKSSKGSVTRAAERKDPDGNAIEDGGSRLEIEALKAELIGLIAKI